MDELLLAEQLFLLAHDEVSGRNRGVTGLDAAHAGGLLLDLAAAGALVAADGRDLRVADVVDGTAAGAPHPLLERVLVVIRAETRARPARYWVDRLPRAVRHLDREVAASLVRRGVVEERRGRFLGMTTRAWPPLDPAPEQALRTALADVLVRGTPPTHRLALLVALLQPLGLVDRLVDRADRAAARRRAADVVAGLTAAPEAGVPRAVARSVADVQAAVVAAVVVPAAVAASGATG